MTATEEVLIWTPTKWLESLEKLSAMGLLVDLFNSGQWGWRVVVRKGSSSTDGTGATPLEALQDWAVRWLESQSNGGN